MFVFVSTYITMQDRLKKEIDDLKTQLAAEKNNSAELLRQLGEQGAEYWDKKRDDERKWMEEQRGQEFVGMKRDLANMTLKYETVMKVLETQNPAGGGNGGSNGNG